MKQMPLGDLFTGKQFEEALALYKTADPGTFAKLCAEKIVQPNIAAISHLAGQEMDAMFLAYQLELAFMQMEKKK